MNLSTLIEELRSWVATNDPHVRAAVELIIEHDVWLRRPEFLSTAVPHAADGHFISWRAARENFDAGTYSCASSTELAVLDLAIDLGADRYRLSRMGDYNSTLIRRTVSRALPISPEEYGAIMATVDSIARDQPEGETPR
jgi:hypothetical protein